LYSCDTILKRLVQHLEDMAAELEKFIQEEHAMVRQRDIARHRHVTPTDQAHILDRLVRGATRAGRHHRRAVVRQAGDAVDAGGLEGFGQGHWWQDGGEMTR
jgi:hypothetical protein